MKNTTCRAITQSGGSGPACTPARRSSGHASTAPTSVHRLLTTHVRIDGPTRSCARGRRLWILYGRAHAGSRAASRVSGAANSMNVSMLTSIVPTGNSQNIGSS